MFTRTSQQHWIPSMSEACIILGLCVLYAFGFGPGSPAHSALEIFGQDSYYLLESLRRGVIYPWNPQNHLLHHVLVDGGYAVWRRVFGAGGEVAFYYLKSFTVLSGLGFLLALRLLFVELGREFEQAANGRAG